MRVSWRSVWARAAHVIAVDISALVAVVPGEPELERFAAIMAREPCVVSAASVTEAAVVLESRQGADAVEDLRRVIADAGIEVVSEDEALAWQRFGRGHHSAQLNYGDCFSYALAKSLAVPLLFEGDDFTRTDIEAAR